MTHKHNGIFSSISKWVFPLLIITLFGLLISGCGDIEILKKETRTAWLPERGISIKESSLMQVKNLSRDLELCIGRTNLSSLSEESLLGLSKQQKATLDALKENTPSCDGIIEYLSQKIAVAREAGNSQEEVYSALMDGQLDAALSQ